MKGVAAPVQSNVRNRVSPRSATPAQLACQAAFQKIAENCVHLIQKQREAAIEADPDAIHTMRIQLTRLRAAVLFFSPMTDDNTWPEIDKELRWLNSALGKARDHDVTVSYARRKRYRRWAKSSRRAMLRAERKADRRLSKKLASARYERLITVVMHWITDGHWLQNDRSVRFARVDDQIDQRLRTWRKGIYRQGRHLRALHRNRLHRLRIHCKRYRYIVATLQGLGVNIAKRDLRFAKAAKSIHGTLGDLRDLRRLRRTAPGRPPGYRKSKRLLLQRAERMFGGI